MIGACTNTSLCGSAIVDQPPLTTGGIAGIAVGVVIGVAILAGVAFVAYRIIASSKKEAAGGEAKDFAAE